MGLKQQRINKLEKACISEKSETRKIVSIQEQYVQRTCGAFVISLMLGLCSRDPGGYNEVERGGEKRKKMNGKVRNASFYAILALSKASLQMLPAAAALVSSSKEKQQTTLLHALGMSSYCS